MIIGWYKQRFSGFAYFRAVAYAKGGVGMVNVRRIEAKKRESLENSDRSIELAGDK